MLIDNTPKFEDELRGATRACYSGRGGNPAIIFFAHLCKCLNPAIRPGKRAPQGFRKATCYLIDNRGHSKTRPIGQVSGRHAHAKTVET